MAPPPNDDFANAEDLVSFSGTVSGTTVDATYEASEDNCFDQLGYLAGHDTVWYKITLPNVMNLSWKLVTDEELDAELLQAPNVTNVTLDSVRAGGNPSFFSISPGLAAGVWYFRVRSHLNSAPDSGTFVLHFSFTTAPVNDNIANATGLSGAVGTNSGTTVDATFEPGEDECFDDLGYLAGHDSVWYKFTLPADNEGTLELASANNLQAELFSAGIFGINIFSLTVLSVYPAGPPVGTGPLPAGEYYVRVRSADIDAEDPGPFDLIHTFAAFPIPPDPPPNDDFANATELVGNSGTVSGTTEGATDEDDDPLAFSYSERTVWYKITPVYGRLTLEVTAGTLTDGVMGVYTGTGLGDLTEVAFDHDSGVGLMPLISDLLVPGGVTYYIEIAAYDESSGGTFDLVWSLEPLIAIVATPIRAPRWRYFVAALNGNGITDWSKLASERVVRTLLNSPLSMSGKAPSWDPQVYIPYSDSYEDPYCAEGTRLLWGLRRESEVPPYYVCRAATMIQLVQDEAQGDTAMTSFVGYDPWQYLFSRPVVNVDGQLPGDEGISWSNTQASEIITQLLRNTISAHGHAYIDGGDDSLGTVYYTGTLETGPGMEIESIKFEAGTTVGDAWAQITQTGQCDIVLEPIYDPFYRPDYLVQLNVYDQAGVTRDEAVFGWDAAGGRNVSALSRAIEGGTTRANKALYWASAAGQSGRSVVGTRAASVAKYGEYWAMQTFPELESKAMVPIANAYAEVTVQMRGAGRTTVTFSPITERAPRPWLDYQLGDIVPVIATSQNFRQALEFDPLETPPHSKSYQRIYGWDTAINDNSTETIQILTSLNSGVS